MKICLRCERILPLEAFHAKADGRGPICQVEEVEGAIRSDVNDCPAGDLPVDHFAAPFWLLGCRSTTQVSNNPDIHDRFFRDSCRKGKVAAIPVGRILSRDRAFF
jgi:hypothetical protein